MANFILSAFADEADANLDIQLKVLKEADIGFVEMRGVDGISLIDCDDAKVAEIKSKLEAASVSLSAVGSYIGKIKISDEFEPHLDKFKRSIDIAHKLDAKKIRVFSFFLPQDEDASIFRDEVMYRMTRFLDVADGSGVDVCHENEKDIYGDIPSRVLDLHKTLGPRLKGIFDPANYIMCGVSNIYETMQILLLYMNYFHVKDARVLDNQIVPAGYGDGDFAKIIELFSSNNDGDAFLTLEPHLARFIGFSGLGDDSFIKESEEFAYANTQDAFLSATQAIKNILINSGYKTTINKERGYQIWKK